MTDPTQPTGGQSGPAQNPYADPSGQQYQYQQTYQQGQYQNYQYPPQNTYRPPPKKSHTGLVVGVVFIVVILILGVTMISLMKSSSSDTGGSSDSYKDEYETASEELTYLNTVRMDSLAHDFYETIRDQNAGSVALDQNGATLCAELSRYDRGNYTWTTVDEQYYALTGTYRYDEAQTTLEYVLEQAGVNSTNTNVQNLAAILSFVDTHVSYCSDLDDRYFSPTETLSSGTGDCEDYSMLVASLLEMCGMQTAIAFFENATDSSQGGHAMVLVHMSNLGSYAYYSYSSLTNYGLSSGKWIEIEPQRLISSQHDATWFTNWNIVAAAEA